ncbi:hypothetical protein BCIN_13g04160 [Botrytis cinerea B05.10]|uniref:Uncharacterized protein n=1 Tax=Botryotinia fuckeliana (strain B05.10) TaxID=332648 RepID=A0A384K162_BOTFB|nr:hypothetical protein BCIN_13g04160 [Botrytis cinerea B05.10]ATZ56579.1 hypothetical protein BCIN_13g04160 [Botrytis cinerea B05.10]
MAQRWTFEAPVNVTATSLVNLTWAPHTFNIAKYGDFPLNLWLLRADSQDNTVVEDYAPFLLAGNQDVYNNSVLWTPTVDDIDFNVSNAGTHQLAWEHSSDNTSLNSSSTKFEGWSRGFHIMSPVSSSTSSTSSPTPSSTSSSSAFLTTSVTSATSNIPITTATSQEPTQQTASPTGPSSALTIGLVIGIGILLIIFIAASFWGLRKYRRAKKDSSLGLLEKSPGSPSASNSTMSYNSPSHSVPMSMPHEYYAPSANPMPVTSAELNSYATSYSIPSPARDRTMDEFSPGNVKPAELPDNVKRAEL